MTKGQHRVIKERVDPVTIAEEFIIQEFLKMFPEANDEFYDRIRYYVRQYRHHHSHTSFWRLVAGLSETYLFKAYHRMLQSNMYEWTLEELPIEQLEVRMFDGKIREILEMYDYNVAKAGEHIRKLKPKDRQGIMKNGFDFDRDNYPILVHEGDNGNFILHDGNRRAMNAGIHGIPTLEAYVGRLVNADGKPALHEDHVNQTVKVLKDTNKIDKELVQSLMRIMIEYKKNYINGPELVDMYTEKYFIPYLDDEELKEIARQALEYKVES